MEELIRKLKDKIVDSDAAGVMILTRALEIVWYNSVLEEECGDLGTMRGKTCYEGLAGDSAPHENCTVRRALASGNVERGLSKSDGKRYVVLAVPLGEDHVGEIVIRLPEEEA
jgi:hypothetical protein